jgi:hypothetical protein
MNCLFSLLADPKFLEFFPGLEYKDFEFILKQQEFVCCGGTGMYYQAKDDCMVSCGLKKRLARLSKLLLSFKETWGDEKPFQLSVGGKPHDWLAWLVEYKATSKRGYAYGTQTSKAMLWTLAASSIWRFGFHAHVFSIGKSAEKDLYPQQDFNSASPLVYYVENVQQLWNAEHSYFLAAICDWCEKSSVPLWVEFITEEKKSVDRKKPKSEILLQIEKKIQRLKAQPPLSYVGEKTRSQIVNLCQGASTFL